MTKLSTLIRQMAKEGHRLASLERAAVLSASDDPKDQDKAREIRVRHDYEHIRKKIRRKVEWNNKTNERIYCASNTENGNYKWGKKTVWKLLKKSKLFL